MSEPLALDWMIIRKEKGLPLTQTALDGIAREAVKAGLSLEMAIKKSCENSWAGFKASWLQSEILASTDSDMAKMRKITEGAL